MYTSLAIGATLIAAILLTMLCLLFRAIVVQYLARNASDCAEDIWSSLTVIAMSSCACAVAVWLWQKAAS